MQNGKKARTMKYDMSNSLACGQMFAQYRIESCLGHGAMGVVYKAFDSQKNKYVALKILQTATNDQKRHESFLREVKAIGHLNHKNIVKLYDAGIHPQYYLAMEYVPGRTLAEVVAKENLAHNVIGEIFSKLALALYHAHARNIVHGDIKPRNIIISDNFEPKITDFGLAREKNVEKKHSRVQGTPAYLSPEQLSNNKVDKRSDIYALGVTMYFALTGKLPFDEKSPAALFYQISHSSPTSLRSIDMNISPHLENICLKCLEKSPEDRYANGKFLYKDLHLFLSPPWHSHPLLKKCFSSIAIEWLLVGSAVLLTVALWMVEPQKNTVESSWEFERDKLLYKQYESHLLFAEQMRLDAHMRDLGHKHQEKWRNEMIYRWSTQLKISKNSDAELLLLFARSIMYLKEMPYLLSLGPKNIPFRQICLWGRDRALKANNATLVGKFTALLAIIGVKTKKNIYTKLHMADVNYYLALQAEGTKREQYLLRGVSCEPLPYILHELAAYYHLHYLHEKAIYTARMCLKQSPYNMVVRYYLAINLFSLDHITEALYHLDFIDKHYHVGRKEHLYFKRAEIYIAQRKWELAYQDIQKARQWIDNHFPGKAVFKKMDERSKAWFLILEKARNNNWDLNLQKKAMEIEVYYSLKKIERAYALVDNIESPSLKLAVYRKMLEHKKWKPQQVKAIWQKAYNEVLTLARGSLNKEQNLTALYYEYLHLFLGRYQGSDRLIYLKKSENLRKRMEKQLGHHYERYASEAYLCYENNNTAKAIFLWERALEEAPWYKEYYMKLRDYALVKLYIGAAKQQQKAKEVALKLQKHYAPVNILLANLYRDTDIDKAHSFLQKVNPDDLFIMRNRMDFYLEKATLFMREKNYARANEELETLLLFFPNNALTFSLITYNYIRQKRWQLALDIANKLIAITEPDYSHNVYLFVHPYERRAEIYEKMADLNLQGGSYDKAVADWQQRRKWAENQKDTAEMARIDAQINRIQKKLK